MKISKALLKSIIREELEKELSSLYEQNDLQEDWKQKVAGMAAGAAMMLPGAAQAKKPVKPTAKPQTVAAQKQEKIQNFNVDVAHRGQEFNVSFEGVGAGLQEASFEIPKGMDREEAKEVVAKAIGKKYGNGKPFTMYMPGTIGGIFSATIQLKG